MKLFLLTALIVISLSACTTNKPETFINRNIALENFIQSHEFVSKDHVTFFEVRAWNNLTDRYFTFTKRGDIKYLYEVQTPCYGLYFANYVGFDEFAGSTIYVNQDILVVNSGVEVRCKLKSIYPLTDAEYKEILILEREVKD